MDSRKETEIIEGNRLIAEFMGKELRDQPLDQYGDAKVLKYHSSWDWLMPVVEKIEGMFGGSVSFWIVQVECDIACSDDSLDNLSAPNFKQKAETKIQATWKAVIEFINWHNPLSAL